MFLCTLWASLKNQPSKQNKGIKKSSPSKSQTLLYFCIFKEYLKPAQTQTKAFQWSQSQAGLRSGNQCPRMESLASRFQGWQFPLSLLGGLLQSQMSWYHQQLILQLSRFYWCFLTIHFLRQGEGGKYAVLLQVPVSWAFPSKVPWRVEPDIGMVTYSERNNSLNVETILLMHFKETTL